MYRVICFSYGIRNSKEPRTLIEMKGCVLMFLPALLATLPVCRARSLDPFTRATHSLDPSDFFDPNQPGPHDLIHFRVKALYTAGLNQSLDVWVPSSPGEYPLMYFLDGFAMGTPPAAYAQVLSHVASHGVVVVAPWAMTMETPEHKLPSLITTMAWAEGQLVEKMVQHGVSEEVVVDFGTLLGAGHSAGAHTLVALLKAKGCGAFKALVLLDPVDGADPMGMIPEYCITPGEPLNFALPTLHLAAGFDPVPGFSGLACAPDQLSNERFWLALRPTPTDGPSTPPTTPTWTSWTPNTGR
nr:chlorophyllase-1, chloroplastic-like [Penaeus vannamei]